MANKGSPSVGLLYLIRMGMETNGMRMYTDPKGKAYEEFDVHPIEEIRYEDTLHYNITRRFLENRRTVLHELFSDLEVHHGR